MFRRIKNTLWIGVLISLQFVSCSKDKNEANGDAIIKKYNLAGTYIAQITPAYMGTTPMASGAHTVQFQDLGNGELRMYFEKFRAEPMPFEMTADITMKVEKGVNNLVAFEGANGVFRAEPPNGQSIDPNDIPDGIKLPEGSENGLSSRQATVLGTYAEIEKEGQKTLRFDLKLTPGVPLPIEILIYTKNKK